MSDDTVMVQPVRTFLEGPDLKHPESEAYPVSRSRMLELRGNGLVEHVEAASADPVPAVPVEPQAGPETPVAAPVRRGPGRPAKAR